MPNRKVIISEQELTYMRMLRKQKVSYRSLSLTFGYSLNVIIRALRDGEAGSTGIPERKKGFGSNSRLEFTDSQLKTMAEMYITGLPLAKIARYFKVSRDTIRRRLNEISYETFVYYL